ncbi:MAG TPA: TonB-dependent receptor [Vicinamibacterales bacterium]|nr:TonB-dependent receptor [Vicinamibacterales bacterium]
MRCARVFIAAVIVANLLMPSRAHAQATGQINGAVTDSSGALLPGVTVEATNTATGAVRTSVTGTDGLYTIPLLPPGDYTVKATLQGFRVSQRDGVRVTVAETARVAFQLEVGQISETITVSAEATLVETSNATHGIVIDEQKIVELPLNGRNFTQLGTLIPGVVAPPGGLGGQAGDATPGGFGNATGGFNVNGMRNQSNNFLMDGATNNDTFNTGFVLRPPPDAIEEFKILTHAFQAEYGRNAGSVVNVVTKSGSNRVSGAAWEFNRDDALQARNYFAPQNQPKPELKQNQFGAAVGGPVLRNRLFGFGFYEGYRNDSGITQNILVLSEAQRRGDFSSGAAIRDPLTGQPFPGNIIPANRISPAATQLLQEFVPLPNSPGNRYIVSPTVSDVRDQFGVRFDYHLGARQTILGRYMRSETDRVTPRIVAPVDQRALATLQDALLSHNFVINSNVINQARFSINRITANPAVTSGLSPRSYGINFANTNPLAAGLPSIAVAGFFGGGNAALGDAQQPFVDRVNHVWQLANDFTWINGAHSIKFGVDLRREAMRIAFINRPNGDLSFSGGITGNAAADFLLGLPAQARATTQQAIQDGYGWLSAAYVQDEYRITPRLTLNLGLRYEVPTAFIDKNDAISGFRAGVQSQTFPNAPAGLVYPGDPDVPRGIVPNDTNNVAPRVAMAWDVTGDGRTSFRSAFGVFYDALAGQGDFFQSGVLSPPFTPLIELNTPTPITLEDPLAAVAGPPNPFPPALTIIGWGDQFESPYAYHFNAGVQRQLLSRLGAEVAYVGSRGHNLPIFMEVNPGVYVPGQTTRGARVMPAFALVRPTFSVARSWYDSLQASLRMLPTRGLNFLASYTLGKTTDHVSGLNIGGEARPVLPVVQGDEASIERALEFEKGPALFDARHRFVVSFGYELPGLESASALVRGIAGGWQLNGIYQAQTGFPLTVTQGTVLDIRYMTSRPDVTCDPNDGPKTTTEYFETSCFSVRSLAQTGERPGNAGRNTVRGPGFQRTDLSVFKNFDFAGRHRIQLRVEGFNIFNQARFGQPNGVIGTAPFGQITTAEDGRIVQLGIKYIF